MQHCRNRLQNERPAVVRRPSPRLETESLDFLGCRGYDRVHRPGDSGLIPISPILVLQRKGRTQSPVYRRSAQTKHYAVTRGQSSECFATTKFLEADFSVLIWVSGVGPGSAQSGSALGKASPRSSERRRRSPVLFLSLFCRLLGLLALFVNM